MATNPIPRVKIIKPAGATVDLTRRKTNQSNRILVTGNADTVFEIVDEVVVAPAPPAPVPAPPPAPAPAPAPEPAPAPPAPAPSPAPAPGAFAWEVADAQSILVPPGTSQTIATGVSGLITRIDPDVLPGMTFANVGGNVTLSSASGAPAVDVSRDWIVTVMDSELAIAQNMRTGQTYGYTQSGQRRNIQFAVVEAQDGDTIQISPGAIYSDGVNDGSGYLEGACLHVWKSLTITNVPGQGRWSLAPQSVPYVAGRSGILIREPNQTYSNSGDTSTSNPRKTIVIEGFDFNNWGVNADDHGIKIRANASTGSWDDFHASVTLRNFKLGKLPFYSSASGVSGAVESLTVENGHVYDCGGGAGGIGGNDHNFYISGRTLVMRGVRSNRTRSAAYPFDLNSTMDGHLLKTTFNNALIEGCALDCGPNGDNSIAVQAKGGGNLIVRGCLLISGVHSQTATGAIVFEKEQNNFGGWTFGQAGHSLLVEKNVFINHRPYVAGFDERAMVYCRPPGSSNELDPATIQSFVVRDNIGMSPVPDSKWIRNAPPVYSGGGWSGANSVVPYNPSESAFAWREVLGYVMASGPIAGGELGTLMFAYPHGTWPRSDSARGLG